MELSKKNTKLINGIDTEQLFNTIDLIKENPDIALFKFRASNKWINGTHNSGTIKDFYGALKEDNSRRSVDYQKTFLWVIRKFEFISRSIRMLQMNRKKN